MDSADLDAQALRLAQDHCSRWLGAPATCRGVRRSGPIWIAEAATSHGAVGRFVLKPVSDRCLIRDGATLFGAHAALNVRVHHAGLTPLLPLEGTPGWTAMPFVAGPMLSDMMLDGLRHGDSAGRIERHLIEAANLLAAIARTPAASVGVQPAEVCNADYIGAVTAAWRSRLVRWMLRGSQATRWYDDAPARHAFAARTWGRVLLVDTQPKNLVVSPRGIRAIDFDYTGGNPALTLAHFLISIDRLTLRPRRHDALAFAWKRAFAERFVASEPEIAEDAIAFCPWLVARVFTQQARRRPWLIPLLLRGYGRGLRTMLPVLAELAARRVKVRLAA